MTTTAIRLPLTVRDVSLLADIAEGFSTVEHYDRLDDLRKRIAEIVHAESQQPTAHDRIENALAAIIETGEQCGLAHDRVTDLLLQHPDVKSNAIAAMIGTPDPLKGENGKHSAASAEKVVEQNADYLAFRQLQRAAEVERWRALAKFKAADLRAKYEILKYDRAEGE